MCGSNNNYGTKPSFRPTIRVSVCAIDHMKCEGRVQYVPATSSWRPNQEGKGSHETRRKGAGGSIQHRTRLAGTSQQGTNIVTSLAWGMPAKAGSRVKDERDRDMVTWKLSKQHRLGRSGIRTVHVFKSTRPPHTSNMPMAGHPMSSICQFHLRCHALEYGEHV